MNTYQTAQNRINQLVGIKPSTVKNTFKNTNMNNREKQMYEYLIQQYGQNYFTPENVENMCFCDDGTVWIGNVEFHTPYKLD